jgi:hypothetical protein
MMRAALLAFLLAASYPVLAAQFYRWVDEQGRIEWRDTPPPPTAKEVEKRRIGVSTIETSTLPYSVQQAVKNFPVTLWVFDCGPPCDDARSHLARRGIPHTERNPQTDFEAFRKLTGGTDAPVLFVGSTRLKGYLDSDWDAALDIAGYPRTPAAGYKPPAARKAAPAP